MDSQDLPDTASPSSASSTDSQLLAFAQVEPRTVIVPYKVLLDLILEDLHLPKAEYHLEICGDGSVRMSILLKTPTLQLQNSGTGMWIRGIWSTDYKEAEDSASMEAIRYIEEDYNVVIRDVNYARLTDLEDQNRNLLHQLKEADQHKRRLAKGWFLAVRNMYSFSRQMTSVVVLDYSLQESPMDKLWNSLLCNIADMGFRLKHIGLRLEKRLEKMLNHS